MLKEELLKFCVVVCGSDWLVALCSRIVVCGSGCGGVLGDGNPAGPRPGIAGSSPAKFGSSPGKFSVVVAGSPFSVVLASSSAGMFS